MKIRFLFAELGFQFHVQSRHLLALSCTALPLHQEVLVHHISMSRALRMLFLLELKLQRERTAEHVTALQMLTAPGCASSKDPAQVRLGF